LRIGLPRRFVTGFDWSADTIGFDVLINRILDAFGNRVGLSLTKWGAPQALTEILIWLDLLPLIWS
jgi:hypothetical protein